MNIWELMRKTLVEKRQIKKINDDFFVKSIDDAKKNMFNFINGSLNYLDPIDVERVLDENNNVYLNAKDRISNIFFLNFKMKKIAKQFVDYYESYTDLIYKYNKEYVNKMNPVVKKTISMVENVFLDNQQISTISKEVKNHLVVAGAGTGKTTTIIGYIKYLLITGKAMPDELLILSFTNASASEMAERVKKETGYELDVFTFHKLGLDIITEVEKTKPSVYSKGLPKFIKDTIKELSSDDIYKNALCNYFVFYSTADYSEFEFESYKEYMEYLNLNPPTSLKKEVLKSNGELKIANFLAINGIKYQYEPQYKFATATEEYSQYKPDFYLPEYDVYIEYYGIDRNGNVANFFKGKNNKNAKESYNDSIVWKDKIHKENNTKLIKLFAYEHFENCLLDNLLIQLKNFDVKFNPLTVDEIFNSLGKNIIDLGVELFTTIINLMKNTRCDFVELKLRNETLERPLKLDVLIEVLEPIFNSYNEYLIKNNEIDFNDMINMATDYIEKGLYKHNYKYVIVDEYQDIAMSRYSLLKALRNEKDYKLFCVGDDWQSIYRFSGSDVGLTLNFSKYWGKTVEDKIETTYRFDTNMIEISGKFVMQNPSQIKKNLTCTKWLDYFPLEIIEGYSSKYALVFAEEKLRYLPKNSSVFFLGRYNFDLNILDDNQNFISKYSKVEQTIKIYYKPRKDLDITFLTVHRSKGLQADYVFILNNKDANMGFPSKVMDSPILRLLLDNTEHYPFAEERRLFYVALTRAKKKVFLLTEKDRESLFVKELENSYRFEIKKESKRCPICGGILQYRKGRYGPFMGCSNFFSNGCKYTRNIKDKENG